MNELKTLELSALLNVGLTGEQAEHIRELAIAEKLSVFDIVAFHKLIAAMAGFNSSIRSGKTLRRDFAPKKKVR